MVPVGHQNPLEGERLMGVTPAKHRSAKLVAGLCAMRQGAAQRVAVGVRSRPKQAATSVPASTSARTAPGNGRQQGALGRIGGPNRGADNSLSSKKLAVRR